MSKPDNRHHIVWTTQARRELWEVVDGLVLERPSVVKSWLDEVTRAMDHLQVFPEIGRVVPEFHQATIREIILSPYRIIYRVKSKERILQILTVFS